MRADRDSDRMVKRLNPRQVLMPDRPTRGAVGYLNEVYCINIRNSNSFCQGQTGNFSEETVLITAFAYHQPATMYCWDVRNLSYRAGSLLLYMILLV